MRVQSAFVAPSRHVDMVQELHSMPTHSTSRPSPYPLRGPLHEPLTVARPQEAHGERREKRIAVHCEGDVCIIRDIVDGGDDDDDDDEDKDDSTRLVQTKDMGLAKPLPHCPSGRLAQTLPNSVPVLDHCAVGVSGKNDGDAPACSTVDPVCAGDGKNSDDDDDDGDDDDENGWSSEQDGGESEEHEARHLAPPMPSQWRPQDRVQARPQSGSVQQHPALSSAAPQDPWTVADDTLSFTMKTVEPAHVESDSDRESEGEIESAQTVPLQSVSASWTTPSTTTPARVGGSDGMMGKGAHGEVREAGIAPTTRRPHMPVQTPFGATPFFALPGAGVMFSASEVDEPMDAMWHDPFAAAGDAAMHIRLMGGEGGEGGVRGVPAEMGAGLEFMLGLAMQGVDRAVAATPFMHVALGDFVKDALDLDRSPRMRGQRQQMGAARITVIDSDDDDSDDADDVDSDDTDENENENDDNDAKNGDNGASNEENTDHRQVAPTATTVADIRPDLGRCEQDDNKDEDSGGGNRDHKSRTDQGGNREDVNVHSARAANASALEKRQETEPRPYQTNGAVSATVSRASKFPPHIVVADYTLDTPGISSAPQYAAAQQRDDNGDADGDFVDDSGDEDDNLNDDDDVADCDSPAAPSKTDSPSASDLGQESEDDKGAESPVIGWTDSGHAWPSNVPKDMLHNVHRTDSVDDQLDSDGDCEHGDDVHAGPFGDSVDVTGDGSLATKRRLATDEEHDERVGGGEKGTAPCADPSGTPLSPEEHLTAIKDARIPRDADAGANA